MKSVLLNENDTICTCGKMVTHTRGDTVKNFVGQAIIHVLLGLMEMYILALLFKRRYMLQET